MAKVNAARVMVGGVAAGAALFVVNGIVNGALLSGAFMEWAQGMGDHLHAPARGAALGLWTLMSLLYGIAGVWIYAGIRPRYGAGPRTALLAGVLLWIAGKLTVALDLMALGILPTGLILGQLLGGFVAILLGVSVGARLYKE
ncbi:MAG TPA: hypothetical protein VHP13_05215 [Gammaproteobacteria bacterium]|jgi:hypothetical protein|nr:hypothetical protein [Gammaproteobacteria bacterium]